MTTLNTARRVTRARSAVSAVAALLVTGALMVGVSAAHADGDGLTHTDSTQPATASADSAGGMDAAGSTGTDHDAGHDTGHDTDDAAATSSNSGADLGDADAGAGESAQSDVGETSEHSGHGDDAGAAADPTEQSFVTGWSPEGATKVSGTMPECSVELHAQYAVHGADGRLYDGWHPSVVTDPATGAQCTFGHEHGDDPKSSDIYEFAAAQFGSGEGIPFGTVNHASDEYAEATGETVKHRHEDHVGHKVFVANDVALVREDRAGYATDAAGAPIVCDYLIEFHQGSHSADALSNNAHQIMYAAKCSDGTQVAMQALARMGQANSFTEKCSGALVQTSGSGLESSDVGLRVIPDVACATSAAQSGPAADADVWGLYELWETDTTVEMPDGGSVRFDPWFGVRNPSRVASVTGGVGSATATVSLFDSTTSQGWPWSAIAPGLELNQKSAASPFNGAQRDFYLGQTTVTVGSTAHDHGTEGVFYTDPYGGHASTTAFPGSVRQYAAHHDTSSLPAIERWNSGFGKDYGSAQTGVHAAN
ncbi:MSCRAMM family adhesin SdrC [Pseudoclavibacter sp. 13-3]|uniref:MSCRAMM family adhesin SdrC n=1 Tax=Pseudoclavibacter sp. 13-3 TaxID=2901228 RepID=UPI001E2DB77F|nr:MSCRAMM family adhesin SdrC [Pseudoclavibacter sp. 13-3]MCD7100706.1 MSCRAMM family adhesin SdrC [Pseudoclavibacter sp. 13-3]